MPTYSRAKGIADKCRECSYDPLAVGAWRQQIAACENGGCGLHRFRPVPRSCMNNGVIDPTAVAALRAKLEERQSRQR